VIRVGGEMAPRHCPKDREIFTTEAPRPREASTSWCISTLSFTDFLLLIFFCWFSLGLGASVVKILRLRHKITISATHQALLAPNRGVHPIALPVGRRLPVVQQLFCYAWPMITSQLQDAQRELPVLADRALRGEEVFITVGQDKLPLSQATDDRAASNDGPRPERGAWKGRINIPDALYEPWTEEEMGELEA
jgi:hypothetical protein